MQAKYNKTWTALDTDKSGDISKQEFMEWWRLSGRFTGKKMVIVDSARVQGDISVCTKFDPHMTKMIGSFQLSSTEIQISDKEIQDLSLLGAAILSSIKRPEPDPTPKRVVDSKFVWKEEGEIGIASRALMGKTGYNDAFVEEPAAADPAKPKKPVSTQSLLTTASYPSLFLRDCLGVSEEDQSRAGSGAAPGCKGGRSCEDHGRCAPAPRES